MAQTKTKKEKGETTKSVQQQRNGKRKRDEGLDLDVQKKQSEKIQYKCNLKAFWKLINKQRKLISEETKQELKKTPFWNMIKLFLEDNMTCEHVTKKDTEVTILLQHYNKDLKAFQFGKMIEKITIDDVSRILGLPNNGEPFLFDKKAKRTKSRVLQKYFQLYEDAITKRVADKSFEDEVENSKKKKKVKFPEDAAVLLLISFFTSFLFPNTASTLTWDLANACYDLESLNKYNWAAAVLDFLEAGLSKVDGNKLVSIQGCLMIILYWLCDKTKRTECIAGRKTCQQTTMMKWSLHNLNLHDAKTDSTLLEKLFEEGLSNEDATKTEKCSIQEEEEEQIHVILTPTFADWQPKTSEEMKKSAEQAQENIEGIIKDLKQDINQQQWNEANEKMEQLTDSKNQLYEKLQEMWKSCEAAEKREQILKNQLNKKTKKIQNLEKIVSDQQEEIQNLKEKEEEGFTKDFQIYVHDEEKDKEQFSLNSDNKKEDDKEEKVEDDKEDQTFEDDMDTNATTNDDVDQEFAFESDNKKGAQEEEKVDDGQETQKKNENDDADTEVGEGNGLTNSEAAQLQDVVGSISNTTPPDQEDEGKRAKKKKVADVEVPSMVKRVKEKKRKVAAQDSIYKYDTPPEVKKPYKLKGVKCNNNTWTDLPIVQQEKISEFWDTKEEIFWESRVVGQVDRNSLKALIEGKALGANLINGYLEIINQDMHSASIYNKRAHPTWAWTAVEIDDPYLMHKFLFEPLLHGMNKEMTFYFPLLDEFHYTLLILDIPQQKWIFYNPMRPRRGSKTNKHYQNARKMAEKITDWVEEVVLDIEAEEAVQSKAGGEVTRQEVFKNNGKMEWQRIPIIPAVGKTIQWMKQSKIRQFTFEEDLKGLQQKENSLDCGVHLLFYIECLAYGEDLNPKQNRDDLKVMRKVMLQKFLIHPFSWNTKKENPEPTLDAEDDHDDDFVHSTNNSLGSDSLGPEA